MMLLCFASMGFLLVWLVGRTPDRPADAHSPPQEHHCPHCQEPVTAEQTFCPSCHTRLDESRRESGYERG